MKGYRGMVLAVLALLVVLGPGLVLRGLSSNSPVSAAAEPKNEAHEKKEQRELDKQLHGDGNGNLRPDLFRKAVGDFARLKIDVTRELPKKEGATSSADSAGPEAASGGGGVVGVQWTQIGPAPLIVDHEQNFQGQGPDAGQVPDLAIDPRNATDQIIYAAFNDGGLWKSTDGGTSWEPKTDYMPSLSTGAVELDPANPSIVYVGTGNIYNNGYFKGVGIYRSIDAGDTWAQVAGNATLNGFGIHDIKMPAGNTLLVATNNGLFRSNNAGAVFTEVPVGGTTGRFITDIDLDTQAPATTVYAAVSGVGVFRSTDAGLTFPAANNLFTGTNGGPVGFARPAGNFGYLSFAQSTTNTGLTMYANAQRTGDPATNFDGMWRSTDGGANWTDISATANAGGQLDGCQCGYDQTLGVDPVDANRVYAGFQELWHSADGGATNFANISDQDIHWDHHEILFSPPNHRTAGDTTTRAWIGTDGGVHYTDDAGATFVQRNGEIATNLFRAMDIGHGAGNNGYMVGGAQDTGTMHFDPTLPNSPAGTEWHEGVNADGGRSAIDWTNPLDMYGISNGQFIRTTDAGDNWIRPGSTDIDCSPMTSGAAVDPNSGNNVYVPIRAGSTTPPVCNDGLQTGLARSTDGGATFNDSIAMPGGARITYIATTPTDSQLMWVGLNNGQVAVSTDVNAATPTFTQRTVTGAPAGINPIGLAIDPTNTDTVVVVYPGVTGVALPAMTRHVFMTTDAGLTWSQIGGTAGDVTQMVPDLPITSVVIDPQTDPNSIIIASDLGVLRTLDSGATWQRLGLGLPNVNVTSLSIDFTVTPSILRAATYGRSAFELTAAEGPLLGVDCDLGFGVVAVGTAATRECALFNVGSEDLHINGFFRSSGSLEFSIASGPATPVTIPPGAHLDYTIRFAPTNVGNELATFQINSNDQFEPVKTIDASGSGVAGQVLVSSTSLEYNGVPVDNRTTPHDKTLTTTITNQSSCSLCDLRVTGLVIGGTHPSDFSVVGAPATPFTIGAGNSLDLNVRFNPTLGGPRSATLTITTNDAVTPNVVVQLSGTGLKPAMSANPTPLIFGPTVYDPACGSLCGLTLPEQIANTGEAELIIDEVTFSAGPFSGPPATTPPTRVPVGGTFTEQVTFRPTGGPARKVTGTMYVADKFLLDLPANLVDITVPMCGESVGRGVRVLVVDKAGVPYPLVTTLKLTATGVSAPPNVSLKNVVLTTIDPPTSCQTITYHYENQALSTTSQTAPRGSYYTLTVGVKNKKATQTFGLDVNEFKLLVVTVG